MLYHPSHYNIRTLPGNAKDAIVDKYTTFLETHNFTNDSDKQALEQIISYIDGSQEGLIEFVDITDRLDSYRDESLAETFPTLTEQIHGKASTNT